MTVGLLPSPLTIEDAARHLVLYFTLVIVFTWTMSVLIEWPFVVFCLRRAASQAVSPVAIRALAASAVLQTFSYVFIVFWICSAIETSLITETKIVRARDIIRGVASR